MKIAFLGNINNHPFHVAHYFRSQGHEVIVYIDASKNIALHRPESLTYGISYPYPDWIIEETRLENTLWMHFPQIFAKKIINVLNTCDAVVVNHYGHRFIPFLKKNIIKICMFTGGDLETMADYDSVLKMRLSSPKLKYVPTGLKKWYANFSVNQLRRGIRNADLISYFPKGLVPLGDRLLEEIFEGRAFNKYEHYAMFIDGINYAVPHQNNPVKVLGLARFLWKEPFPPGVHYLENKGNDIMIKGIAEYLRQSGKKLDIHFIEKGHQVNESKELINQLGFADMVSWHKEMPMNLLLEKIEEADIVFDQLSNHLVGVGIFGMLKGRPLIANMRPEILGKMRNDTIPVCNAVSPQEVANWLQKLVDNPEQRKEIGLQASKYAAQHFDIKSQAKFFLDFITRNIELKP
jgi:glycosyltransferase involved in cell wall biosynthesis